MGSSSGEGGESSPSEHQPAESPEAESWAETEEAIQRVAESGRAGLPKTKQARIGS